jgi:hypothetical protein
MAITTLSMCFLITIYLQIRELWLVSILLMITFLLHSCITYTAFVLAAVVDNCRPGQSACLNAKLLAICLANLTDPNPMLRQWVTLCLAKLWEDFDEAKWTAIREQAHQRICVLLTDPVAEVKFKTLFSLFSLIFVLDIFIGSSSSSLCPGNIHGRSG